MQLPQSTVIRDSVEIHRSRTFIERGRRICTSTRKKQRFYAYNHFGQHPERLLSWFAKHM
jgi:hypothetical protein